jgi:deoxyribodipyrimidine photo-lyase
VNVVWLKRDIRFNDHVPLVEASKRGPTIVLYVYEPIVWQAPESDVSHLEFVNESLSELGDRLKSVGGRLVCRLGDFLTVLQKLHLQVPLSGLWSHEETGTMATFQRDLAVKRWCRENGIPWHESPQNGVVRRLANRDGWANLWQQRMNQEVVAAPQQIQDVSAIEAECLRDAQTLSMRNGVYKDRQRGGESVGTATLHNFLLQRGLNYSQEMSSPLTAPDACSRISPYLSWGCLSIKQVYRCLGDRLRQLREMSPNMEGYGQAHLWRKSLSAFQSRLHWHCHFIQKLEDEPQLEFQNISHSYDGLREQEWNQDRFDAWCAGQTGYPMVDACMRSLQATGWINFRMRAMLASFASYHLWLHWREPAIFLARHFLDFEPGIHYPQFQMQSGTTGINTLRIYSPAKQAKDHDPEGIFIRRWVPELSEVPGKYLAEPHLMPTALQLMVGCRMGRDYPLPIVEHAAAYKHAKQRLYAVRRTEGAREEASRIASKHGSRKGPNDRQTRRRKKGPT